MSRNPFLSSNTTEDLDELVSILDSSSLHTPPEDAVPESKQSEVPADSGAAKPKIKPISGLKRTWTEKASPEPEAGRTSCQELVLRKTIIEDSNCLRKRVKMNACPAEDSQRMPLAAAPTIEMTSALKLSRYQNNCYFSPEKQPDEGSKPNSLLPDILAAINNAVIPQIESMRRDINNLYRENKRLADTLSLLGSHHPLNDKLEAFPTAPSTLTTTFVRGNATQKPTSEAMDTDMTKRRMSIDESAAQKAPMVVNPNLSLKPRPVWSHEQ